jgi:DNA-3-methyladenine glycosylase II
MEAPVADPLRRDLLELLKLDPRLAAIYAQVGDFPERVFAPGFAGMARTVIGQKISVASAGAAWTRLCALPNATTPEGFLALGEEGVKSVGLTRSKLSTLTSVATALVSGALDLDAIERLPGEAAVAALTRQKGIGRWTAEIYLMFCVGHRDIFPAGDLALQKAVGYALGIEPFPNAKALSALSAAWAPYRSTAALLLWRFYAAIRQRNGVPL